MRHPSVTLRAVIAASCSGETTARVVSVATMVAVAELQRLTQTRVMDCIATEKCYSATENTVNSLVKSDCYWLASFI